MSRAARVALRLAVGSVLLALPATAPAAQPQISAPSAIVIEPSTGDIIYARNASQPRAVASTTKIMTALVTVDQVPLDETLVTVRYTPSSPLESLAGFKPGERVKVRDLLRALMLPSANDAAATLAQRIGGSRAGFVALMNRKARAVGLTHTHFTTPIGLDDPRNYSSAEDLVKLALLLRKNKFLRELVDSRRAGLASGGRDRIVFNRNTLLDKAPWVDGVKTGYTSRAGYVLVGSATRDGVTVVSAVLGTSSEGARDADSLALLRYGLTRYRRVKVVQKASALSKVRLEARGDEVDLAAAADVARTVRRGERLSTSIEGVPAEIDGPLRRGSPLGMVVVRQRGRTVGTVPLVTTADIAPATFWDRLDDRLISPVALVALALGSLYLVLLRRRAVRRRQRVAAADSEAMTA